MTLYIDADACPVKDEAERVATRLRVRMVLVSNGGIRPSAHPLIETVIVAQGPDEADKWIAERAGPGDVVVTADIPLAARVLEKGALALNPRGELYTADSIAQRLSMRNFMDELRGAGVDTGGPAGFHARDRQAFGNALDRWLAKQPRPPAPAQDTP